MYRDELREEVRREEAAEQRNWTALILVAVTLGLLAIGAFVLFSNEPEPVTTTVVERPVDRDIDVVAPPVVDSPDINVIQPPDVNVVAPSPAPPVVRERVIERTRTETVPVPVPVPSELPSTNGGDGARVQDATPEPTDSSGAADSRTTDEGQ